MPAVSTYSPTGDPYVDSLLTGTKWAVTSFTYSFPTDASFYGASYGIEPTNNFEAFNPTQIAATQSILNFYSSVANVTFTQVTESATVHGDLRYAESDAPSTAWSYYPSTASQGGDAWFNNSANKYDNPVLGNYAYLTLMHETGHSMGLKHPHQASGSFGIMPTDHDSLEYSVMSYKSYVGGSATGYTVSYGNYPQTLMMDDIAAVQQLYGANYNTNSGDTVYSWSPTTGQTFINGVGQALPAANVVFMTIWDGGGTDTYDFSNYSTNLTVNLQPGSWTGLGTQLANLGNGHYAVGNIANALLYQDNPASLIENVIGGSGNDTIIGNLANNAFTGNGGNDWLDGGLGADTAFYSGLFTDYTMVLNADGTWTVTDLRSLDGVDTLTGFEFLHFSDTTLTIGTAPPPPPPPPPPPTENDAPVATDDAHSVNKGKKLTIGGTGVLANDFDPDGDLLSSILVTGPAHGTLTLNANGTFSYTPFSTYVGADSFTYMAVDALGASDLATVTINVLATTSNGKGRPGRGSGEHDVTEDQIPAEFSWDARPHISAGIAGQTSGSALDYNGLNITDVLPDPPSDSTMSNSGLVIDVLDDPDPLFPSDNSAALLSALIAPAVMNGPQGLYDPSVHITGLEFVANRADLQHDYLPFG